jgi:hypothetical protein
MLDAIAWREVDPVIKRAGLRSFPCLRLSGGRLLVTERLCDSIDDEELRAALLYLRLSLPEATRLRRANRLLAALALLALLAFLVGGIVAGWRVLIALFAVHLVVGATGRTIPALVRSFREQGGDTRALVRACQATERLARDGGVIILADVGWGRPWEVALAAEIGPDLRRVVPDSRPAWTEQWRWAVWWMLVALFLTLYGLLHLRSR